MRHPTRSSRFSRQKFKIQNGRPKNRIFRILAIKAPIFNDFGVCIYVHEVKEYNKTYLKCITIIFSDQNIKKKTISKWKKCKLTTVAALVLVKAFLFRT